MPARCLVRDRLIVVDKSSTDISRSIAHAHMDRVVVVPWTPAIDETRTLARRVPSKATKSA
jgi:hypothetical protein